MIVAAYFRSNVMGPGAVTLGLPFDGGDILSWRASAHVKPLTNHADGSRLTAREKLILFVLADCHNDEYDCAWIGIKKAARHALTSRSRFIELLNRLEQKGTVLVEKREGRTNLYRFPGLVRSSDGYLGRGVRGSDHTGPTATGPGGPIASGPKPSISLEGTEIQPPSAVSNFHLVEEAIRRSRAEHRPADEILKELRVV